MEHLSVNEEYDRLEEYKMNVERLKDVIDCNKRNVTDGATSVHEDIYRLQATLRANSYDSYNTETANQLDAALSVQIEKIKDYTNQTTDDMNEFLWNNPNKFFIESEDEIHPINHLEATGEGADLQINLVHTDQGKVDLTEKKYTLMVRW